MIHSLYVLGVRHTPIRWRGGWLLALCLLLTGCGHVMRLEHTVQTHTDWDNQHTPVPGDRFVFERSPAQQADTQAAIQAQLETQTTEWLQAWGSTVVREKDEAQWVIQLMWRHQRTWRDPWGDPFFPGPLWGLPGRDYVVTGSGQVVWLPALHRMPTLHHERELRIQIRDVRSYRIVFDSQATQEGPWNASPILTEALVEAALNGFPLASKGTRQVVIEKPRRPAASR